MDKDPKVGIVIQAREGSTRLPGKVVMPVEGVPLLERLIRRMRMSRTAGGVIVATGAAEGNRAIASLCDAIGVECFFGSEENVLDRMLSAADRSGFETVVRVTADNPLIDPWGIDEAVSLFLEQGLDHLDNIWFGGYPHGAGSEVVSRTALAFSLREWTFKANLEHVTWGIRLNPRLFRNGFFQADPALHRPRLRFSVDHAEDLAVVRSIYRIFGGRDDIRLPEVIAFLDSHPDVAGMNAMHAESLPTREVLLAQQLQWDEDLAQRWAKYRGSGPPGEG
jgi:spore coat polysaccharide biosynthesis protein SpsF